MAMWKWKYLHMIGSIQIITYFLKGTNKSLIKAILSIPFDPVIFLFKGK